MCLLKSYKEKTILPVCYFHYCRGSYYIKIISVTDFICNGIDDIDVSTTAILIIRVWENDADNGNRDSDHIDTDKNKKFYIDNDNNKSNIDVDNTSNDNIDNGNDTDYDNDNKDDSRMIVKEVIILMRIILFSYQLW